MDRSTLILTDSGGIQEEAPSLGKPVLVHARRDRAARGAGAGAVELVGTDSETIVERVDAAARRPGRTPSGGESRSIPSATARRPGGSSS